MTDNTHKLAEYIKIYLDEYFTIDTPNEHIGILHDAIDAFMGGASTEGIMYEITPFIPKTDATSNTAHPNSQQVHQLHERSRKLHEELESIISCEGELSIEQMELRAYDQGVCRAINTLSGEQPLHIHQPMYDWCVSQLDTIENSIINEPWQD